MFLINFITFATQNIKEVEFMDDYHAENMNL
jgi:hypothetical protein